jgi:hypothetical protein
MTKPEFNRIMNFIVLDFCVIVCLMTIGLFMFGNVRENGDSNAASNYGIFILPLIPIILIALGLIQMTKAYFKSKNVWLSSLTPSILAIIAVWLKPTLGYILVSCLLFIIFYSILKQLLHSNFSTKTHV